MDAQFWFFNVKKYKYFDKALGKKDGIVVLDVLIDASGTEDNPLFAKITNFLIGIQRPNITIEIPECFNFFSEISWDTEYFMYQESDYTTWIIYRIPLLVSEAQVRTLKWIENFISLFKCFYSFLIKGECIP